MTIEINGSPYLERKRWIVVYKIRRADSIENTITLCARVAWSRTYA